MFAHLLMHFTYFYESMHNLQSYIRPFAAILLDPAILSEQGMRPGCNFPYGGPEVD